MSQDSSSPKIPTIVLETPDRLRETPMKVHHLNLGDAVLPVYIERRSVSVRFYLLAAAAGIIFIGLVALAWILAQQTGEYLWYNPDTKLLSVPNARQIHAIFAIPTLVTILLPVIFAGVATYFWLNDMRRGPEIVFHHEWLREHQDALIPFNEFYEERKPWESKATTVSKALSALPRDDTALALTREAQDVFRRWVELEPITALTRSIMNAQYRTPELEEHVQGYPALNEMHHSCDAELLIIHKKVEAHHLLTHAEAELSSRERQ